MKLLLAGFETAFSKAFVKENKKKFEMIALDLKKEDFSQFMPMRAVFESMQFDAVVYFAASGEFDSNACLGEVNLFKNLQYASIMFGIKKMITCLDKTESLFGQLIPDLVEKDKIGTVLQFYGLYGTGLNAKINPLQRLMSNAKKKGEIIIKKDREISAVCLSDAVKLLTTVLQKDIEQGVYDIAPAKSTTLVEFAKAIKKVLGSTKITLEEKEENDAPIVGDSTQISIALPKFKFTVQNTAVAKVLMEMR